MTPTYKRGVRETYGLQRCRCCMRDREREGNRTRRKRQYTHVLSDLLEEGWCKYGCGYWGCVEDVEDDCDYVLDDMEDEKISLGRSEVNVSQIDTGGDVNPSSDISGIMHFEISSCENVHEISPRKQTLSDYVTFDKKPRNQPHLNKVPKMIERTDPASSCDVVFKHPKGSYHIINKPCANDGQKSMSEFQDFQSGANCNLVKLTQFYSDLSYQSTTPMLRFDCVLKASEVDISRLSLRYSCYVESQSQPRRFIIYKFSDHGSLKPFHSIIVLSQKPSDQDLPLSLCKYEVTVYRDTGHQPLLQCNGILDLDELVLKTFGSHPQPGKDLDVTKKTKIALREQFSRFSVSCLPRSSLIQDMLKQSTLSLINKNVEYLDKSSVFGSDSSVQAICPVCLDDSDSDEFTCMNSCGHLVCNRCWKEYINAAIESNQDIKCPEFGCQATVDLVTLLYFAGVCKWISYVNRKIETKVALDDTMKFCPTPDCTWVAQCKGGHLEAGEGHFFDTPTVFCGCQGVWCYVCTERAHWPASCQAFLSFNKFDQTMPQHIFDGEGNFYKVDVFVKRCPFCRVLIEKEDGCNYMHCICGKEFCWRCLAVWNNHDDRNCKEAKYNTYTFSSLDDQNGQVNVQQYKKALKFSLKVKKTRPRIEYLDKRLHLLNDTSKLSSDDAKYRFKFRVARDALQRLVDTYELLEMLHVESCKWKSRHTIHRLTRYVESVEIHVEELEKLLPWGKLCLLDMKNVSQSMKILNSKLSELKYFGLVVTLNSN